MWNHIGVFHITELQAISEINTEPAAWYYRLLVYVVIMRLCSVFVLCLMCLIRHSTDFYSNIYRFRE